MAEDERARLGPLFTLADAAAKFFAGGKITAASLRTEIAKGRLGYEKIAGKYRVSEADIEQMRRLCRVPPRLGPADPSLEQADMIRARDAALAVAHGTAVRVPEDVQTERNRKRQDRARARITATVKK